MSIFDELSRQQRQVSELLVDLQAQVQRGQTELAFVTFQLLANKLTACMRAEHAVVYPRFAREAGLATEIAQAHQQHAAIEQTLTRMRVGGLNRLAWRVELTHLVKLVDEHAELEELTLFPMAALTFSSEQLAELGTDFAAYLAVAITVADAAITYDAPELEPVPPRVVRVQAA